MVYRVDIDGTIANTTGNDYENAIPIPEYIAKINKLFNEGHIIIYWTSRGNTSKRDWLVFTLEQLNSWGCLFNSLQVSKPSYDFLIDDKSLRIEEI